MQRTVVPGVSMWSVWQPDRNLFFNAFFIQARPGSDDGNLIVDPLPLSDADAAEIEAAGGAAWIAITNRDHERDARAVAARFGAKVASSHGDASLLSAPVDRMLGNDDVICGGRVIALDGAKTPGEFALHFRDRQAVVIGDVLWGTPAGSVRLMPDDKLADPARATLSLRHVRAMLPEHLLLGDGAPIFGNATAILQTALEARTDAYVNLINEADVPVRSYPGEPEGYGGTTREIGDYIGSQHIGFRLMELEPGAANCPLHWHSAEEELFIVLSGAATLVTQRGEHPLRAGDYVAFPTRIEGAHKIVNRGSEPVRIVMIANTHPHDVCSYPDSKKVLVESRGLIVRDNPELDYCDGE